MPELPEVQTTVNALARHIRERVIVGAWMDPVKSIGTGKGASWPVIKKYITGHQITTVTRRAKYIVIGLDDGAKLWIHQKMTGHLLVGRQLDAAPLAGDPRNAYIRLTLALDNGMQVGLSDARRFAKILLTRNNEEIARTKELSGLGPEPLELVQKKFVSLFAGKRGLIKPTLMNPAFIVGIGNIYADEILHRAGIHPFRSVQDLATTDLNRIHGAMRNILAAAIKAGGSSTHDYRTPDGTKGGYQNRHRAYQRTGQTCTICHQGTIERVMRNGRSSHFCAHHQQ